MTTFHHLQDITTDGSKENVPHKEQAGQSFLGPPVTLVNRPGGRGYVTFSTGP